VKAKTGSLSPRGRLGHRPGPYLAVLGTAAVAAAMSSVVLASAPVAGDSSSGADPPRLGCPKKPLALGRDAPAPATVAALSEAKALYGPDHDRAVADGAVRARAAGVRGLQVRRTCGRLVFRRTVVVSLRFPQLRESASLSSGVVFVARLPDGYHVWEVAH
jgi:hypothetical protein